MCRLLARRLGRLRDGGVLRGGDHRAKANFSATRVRFYFSLALSPLTRPLRRLLPRRALPPMRLLRPLAPRRALRVMHTTWAIDLAPIAAAAQMEDAPAGIQNTLNLPQIVHSRPRPQRTRPPAGTRATTPASNASTRGDSGLGGDDSGPHYFCAVGAIVRSRRPLGQLLRQAGLLRFPRFSAAADKAGLLHHTDRGSPYAALAYTAILRQYGVVASMSRAGDCYDNAVVESFFGTLKAELIGGRIYPSRVVATAAVRDYIENFYNTQRRHSHLQYLSPVEFELRSQAAALAA